MKRINGIIRRILFVLYYCIAYMVYFEVKVIVACVALIISVGEWVVNGSVDSLSLFDKYDSVAKMVITKLGERIYNTE